MNPTAPNPMQAPVITITPEGGNIGRFHWLNDDPEFYGHCWWSRSWPTFARPPIATALLLHDLRQALQAELHDTLVAAFSAFDQALDQAQAATQGLVEALSTPEDDQS